MKLLPRLGGVAAAAALVLVVGAGPASANTTRYHKSDGTVVSITTPGTVSATYGRQTQFPVTVSVDGPSPLRIAWEKLLTPYGPDNQNAFDGLSIPQLGCWGKTLTSGQSCTSQVRFAPTFVGTRTEAYMLATGLGNMQARFTATGVPCGRVCQVRAPVGPPLASQ